MSESITYKNPQEKYRKEHPDKAKEHTDKWRAKNKERVSFTKRLWRLLNKDKVAAQKKQSYERNREATLKKNKEKYKQNPERKKEVQAKYAASHKEDYHKRSKLWRLLNPEKKKIHENTRRMRKLAVGGEYTSEEWKSICEKYNNKCLCCGEQKPLTVDHVIPISKGGRNEASNIQPLCRECNSSKHTKEIDYR